MTIYRQDAASPQVLLAVEAVLRPLLRHYGLASLRLLPSRVLPQGAGFSINGSLPGGAGPVESSGRVVVELRPRGRSEGGRLRAWALPGWSLGAVVVLAAHVRADDLREPPPQALDACAAVLLLEGHVGMGAA